MTTVNELIRAAMAEHGIKETGLLANMAEDMFFCVGHNNAPYLLSDLHQGGWVLNSDLPGLLPGVWTMAERPTHNLDPETWLHFFEAVGYHNAAGQRIDRPEHMTLYRGGSINEMFTRSFGMSWTTSRETALWFAQRWEREDHVIYTCTVPGHLLLADYRDAERNEAEVVVRGDRLDRDTIRFEDPADLEDAQLAENIADHFTTDQE